MDSIKELSAAMAKAFPEIEGALKDSTNPHFKSKYADLSSVVAAVKPALVKHNLWYRQVMHPSDNGVSIETVIHHASGEFLSCGTVFVPASKHDAQGFGSACTYARRYSLQTAFGVAAEDDDGQAAVKSAPAKNEQVKLSETPTVSDARMRIIRKVADACIAEHARDNGYGVYENYVSLDESDERLVLWKMLSEHSAVRSTIKRYGEEEKAKAAA